MKLKELLEQYSDVELTKEQVKQVKDYLGIKETKKWRPRLNEKYFFIDSYGDVSDEYTDHEQNAEWDDYRIFTNNCFKTKKEQLLEHAAITVLFFSISFLISSVVGMVAFNGLE